MSDDPYQAPSCVGSMDSVPVVKEPLDTIVRRVFLAGILFASALAVLAIVTDVVAMM